MPPGAGEPRTALQQQVAQAAPGIFAVAAAPPQPLPQAGSPELPQAVAAAEAPAAHPRRCGGDKPPAAKRARVAAVAVAAAHAAVEETPAEEAAKAAGGCCSSLDAPAAVMQRSWVLVLGPPACPDANPFPRPLASCTQLPIPP